MTSSKGTKSWLLLAFNSSKVTRFFGESVGDPIFCQFFLAFFPGYQFFFGICQHMKQKAKKKAKNGTCKTIKT